MKPSDKIKESVKVGEILPNVRRGNSKILSVGEDRIWYERGKSRISLMFADLDSAYEHFEGKNVSTKDLKEFNPHAFTSETHECNATFFFQILYRIGFIKGEIQKVPICQAILI